MQSQRSCSFSNVSTYKAPSQRELGQNTEKERNSQRAPLTSAPFRRSSHGSLKKKETKKLGVLQQVRGLPTALDPVLETLRTDLLELGLSRRSSFF